MSIGPRLREIRNQRQMTVSALADASTLSKGFISQIESGLSEPSLQSLRRIAEALQVPLSDLLSEMPLSLATGPRNTSGHNFQVIRGDRTRTLNPVEHLFSGLGAQVLRIALHFGERVVIAVEAADAVNDQAFVKIERGLVTVDTEGRIELSAGDMLKSVGATRISIANEQSALAVITAVVPSSTPRPQVDLDGNAGVAESRRAEMPSGPFRLVEMRAGRTNGRQDRTR